MILLRMLTIFRQGLTGHSSEWHVHCYFTRLKIEIRRNLFPIFHVFNKQNDSEHTINYIVANMIYNERSFTVQIGQFIFCLFIIWRRQGKYTEQEHSMIMQYLIKNDVIHRVRSIKVWAEMIRHEVNFRHLKKDKLHANE